MNSLILINTILLTAMVVSALWAVLARSLMRAAVALLITSALLTVFIYRLNCPIAAVFELSVCAGLIPVLFISSISLSQPLTKEKIIEHSKSRMSRFWYLPFILVLAGIAMSLISVKIAFKLPPPEFVNDVRVVLWSHRHIDILGQIIILLCGAFGVLILFKERKK